MSKIKTIRDRLGLTQTALAQGIGCTQGNIGHYETKGQTMPPEVAKRLINFAASHGVEIGFEDVYGPAAEAAQVATSTERDTRERRNPDMPDRRVSERSLAQKAVA